MVGLATIPSLTPQQNMANMDCVVFGFQCQLSLAKSKGQSVIGSSSDVLRLLSHRSMAIKRPFSSSSPPPSPTPTTSSQSSKWSQQRRYNGVIVPVWLIVLITLLSITTLLPNGVLAQCCNCPTSAVCPNVCNGCISQNPSCTCLTNCTSLGCPVGTTEAAPADSHMCSGGEAQRTCQRTDCTSVLTSTCQSCKAGRYGAGKQASLWCPHICGWMAQSDLCISCFGTACTNVCPGGIAQADGTVTNICSDQGSCSAGGICTCNSGYTG
jgi:hypothetical protein